MGFNFGTAGAAMGGAQSATTPFISGILDRAQKSKAKDDRQAKITDAYQSLFPKADPEQLGSMLELMLQGVSIPGKYQEDILRGMTVGEVNKGRMANLPPEVRKVVSTFTPEAQNKYFEERGFTKAEEIEQRQAVDSAVQDVMRLNSELIGEDGLIDRKSMRNDPVKGEKYFELISALDIALPHIPGNKQRAENRNWFLTGHTTISGSPKTATGFTTDQNKLMESIRQKANQGLGLEDLNPIEFSFAFNQLGLKSPEEFGEFQGLIKVGPRVFTTVTEAIRSETKSLSGDFYRDNPGMLFSDWASGLLDPKTDPKTGEVIDHDRILRQQLEKYYHFGTGDIKQKQVIRESKDLMDLAEIVSLGANMRDGAVPIWQWLQDSYFETGGEWDANWDAELIARGATQWQIDTFYKPSLRAMKLRNFKEVAKDLRAKISSSSQGN